MITLQLTDDEAKMLIGQLISAYAAASEYGSTYSEQEEALYRRVLAELGWDDEDVARGG